MKCSSKTEKWIIVCFSISVVSSAADSGKLNEIYRNNSAFEIYGVLTIEYYVDAKAFHVVIFL
jgi:hypothetical protein